MTPVPFPIYLLLPSGIFIFLVGLYSWLKTKNRESFIFFLFTVAISLVSFLTFFLYFSCGDEGRAIFLDKLLYIPGIFIPVLIYHFSLEFCKEKNIKLRRLLYVGYFFSFIFACLTQTNYFVKGIFNYQWGCHTVAQIGHNFWVALVFPYVLLALFVLFKKAKELHKFDNERFQIIYVAIGIIFFLPYGLEILPAYKISIYPFGYLALPLFALIVSYTITEKQLFAPTLATHILVSAILIFLFTFIMFPQMEIEFGIVGRLVFFIFIAFLCFLLLRYSSQEAKRQEELQRAYSELKTLDDAKTEFLSIASHQLRTPLTAIMGYASMLKEGVYGKIPEKAQKAIDYIHQSSVRMIGLVNDLLNVSRIQTGKVQLKLEDVLIESLIQESIEDVKLLAQQKNLFISFEKPAQPLPMIKADREKLKQIIINLLDNAIRYTDKGGITVKCQKTETNNCLISISDTGQGMELDEINKLFKSFSRGKAGLSTHTQGTGLGLYTAKKFIELHNGKIWAESEGHNKGSTFYIELPIEKQ